MQRDAQIAQAKKKLQQFQQKRDDEVKRSLSDFFKDPSDVFDGAVQSTAAIDQSQSQQSTIQPQQEPQQEIESIPQDWFGQPQEQVDLLQYIKPPLFGQSAPLQPTKPSDSPIVSDIPQVSAPVQQSQTQLVSQEVVPDQSWLPEPQSESLELNATVQEHAEVPPESNGKIKEAEPIQSDVREPSQDTEEFIQLREQNTVLQEQIKQISVAMEASQFHAGQRMKQLTQDNDHLMELVDKNRLFEQELQLQIEALKQMQGPNTEEYNLLKQHLEQSKATVLELDSGRKQLESKVSVLEQQVGSLKHEAQRSADEAKFHKNNAQSLFDERQQLQKQLMSSVKSDDLVSMLQQEKDELTGVLANATDQAEEQFALIQQLQSQVDVKNSEALKLIQYVSQVCPSDLPVEVDQFANWVELLQSHVAKLQVQSSQQESKALLEKEQQSELKVQELQEKVDQLQQDLHFSVQENRRLTLAQSDMQAFHQKKEAQQVDALQVQLSDQKKVVDDLKQELESERLQADSNQSQLESLQLALATANQTIDQLQAEIERRNNETQYLSVNSTNDDDGELDQQYEEVVGRTGMTVDVIDRIMLLSPTMHSPNTVFQTIFPQQEPVMKSVVEAQVQTDHVSFSESEAQTEVQSPVLPATQPEPLPQIEQPRPTSQSPDPKQSVVVLKAHVEQLRRVWDHEVKANETLRTILTELRAKFIESEQDYLQRIEELESDLAKAVNKSPSKSELQDLVKKQKAIELLKTELEKALHAKIALERQTSDLALQLKLKEEYIKDLIMAHKDDKQRLLALFKVKIQELENATALHQKVIDRLRAERQFRHSGNGSSASNDELQALQQEVAALRLEQHELNVNLRSSRTTSRDDLIPEALLKERNRHKQHCHILTHEVAEEKKKVRKLTNRTRDLVFQKKALTLAVNSKSLTPIFARIHKEQLMNPRKKLIRCLNVVRAAVRLNRSK